MPAVNFGRGGLGICYSFASGRKAGRYISAAATGVRRSSQSETPWILRVTSEAQRNVRTTGGLEQERDDEEEPGETERPQHHAAQELACGGGPGRDG